jgi:ketosteroid isomerase-like protein
MVNLTNNSTALWRGGFARVAAALLFVTMLSVSRAPAQSVGGGASPGELHDRIARLDAALFDAYNRCDIDKVAAFFTDDLEFYHEKGGLVLTRQGTLDLMRKNLCGNNNKVRRELVKGSMEVRPIKEYGAVQTGEHRFYLTQPGREEKMDGIGKFVMLWRVKDGEWRVSRVISYGFRAPE